MDKSTNEYDDISYIIISNDKEGNPSLPRYIVRYVKDIDVNNGARQMANRIEPINFEKFQMVEVAKQIGMRLSKSLIYRLERFLKYVRRYTSYSYNFTTVRTCMIMFDYRLSY